MRGWTAARVAAAAGATLVGPPPAVGGASGAPSGPSRAVIDSREAGPGDLFVGLAGTHVDGGRFAAQALAAGAWGVLVEPAHADAARCARPGALLAADDPLRALQALAREWRRELGASVVAITGSTGKTSTKEILSALLSEQLATVASPRNLNTEIGLPLALLEAPAATQALVLELAMRGSGQIAELTAICEPDVGVIVNIGPAHVELLGSLEAIAAAKAELIAGLAPGTTAVVPAGEPLLAGHIRDDVATITFGDGGDVRLLAAADGSVTIAHGDARIELRPSFSQAHQLQNLLAAVAAARALGVTPDGAVDVVFGDMRGERIELPGGMVVINDCYNANPMSMRAALDDLALSADGRRVAVLGDMLELGADAERFHRELGRQAHAAGVELLITVGELSATTGAAYGEATRAGEHRHVPDAATAAALLAAAAHEGDTVLVKGSRAIGLEVVAERLVGDAAGAAG
jgi:UDP-N-acetylmuramoyl-tripeptide--D-alanyl-D-alanine ligase